MAEKSKSGGGAKKYGRFRDKCKTYRASGRLERRKVRNMLRSCGPEATLKWADEHDLLGVLRSLQNLKIYRRAVEKSQKFARFAGAR